MPINLSKFAWERARKVNRIPGAHAFYRVVTGLIYWNGRTVTISRGPGAGLRWRHYSQYQPWMAIGLYEPHVANLIVSLLRPGDVFYDIGANAGYYTLLSALAVGPEGSVIAFDPVPQNAGTVREQIALNGLQPTCRVEEVAIAGQGGTLSFVVDSINANSHLSDWHAPSLSNDGQKIAVRAITLDEYVRSHPRPSVIKMDIEGAELEALLGARELLSDDDAPVMLVSTHSKNLDEECKALLSEYGYVFHNLRGFEQMIHATKSPRA